MNSFTIKDLENLSGIKAHTIRIWEQRYHFLKPKRTDTNIRKYSNEELKTILNIALLNKYGFKISHIDKMNPEEINGKILSLGDARAVQERLINSLVQEMADLDMEKFEKILNAQIAVKGVERTVMQVIFPFLDKIGILWQTGNINPAQEHLVSNIIRQKLILGIEKVVPATRIEKTVLLFLPEDEHHELGLLFLYYLLKSRGATTIYIGANIPLADVEEVARLKKPDLAFVHLTGTGPGFHFEKFLGNVNQRLRDTKTIVSGLITVDYKKKVPPSVELKRSLSEMMSFILTL
jgi:DNA-binding transcriptional MerR regulator